MEQFTQYIEQTVKTVRQVAEWSLFQWEKSIKEGMEQAEKFFDKKTK